MMEEPDYRAIVDRAARGEYRHRQPLPIPVRVGGVLGKAYWPFGKALERYLEKHGIAIPDDAKAITLRYECHELNGEYGLTENVFRVTIKRRRGKKQRYYTTPPWIDNDEATDT